MLKIASSINKDIKNGRSAVKGRLSFRGLPDASFKNVHESIYDASSENVHILM